MNPRLARILLDKRWRRAALLLSLWVPAVVILILAREVLLPFLLAFTFAYVLAPVVRRLSELDVRGRHLPRWAAVLVVYAVLAAVLWVAGVIFVPQLYREAARLAKDATEALNRIDDRSIAALSQRLAAFFDSYNLPVHIVTPDDVDGQKNGHELVINLVDVIQGIVRDVKSSLSAEARALFGKVQIVVARVIGAVFRTFLVLMLTAFIAADTQRIVDFILSIIPVSDRRPIADLLVRIDRGLSGVVRGQLTICFINGAFTLVGLLLLHVKFAFLLATLAAVFSLVPIFGSILSSIPIFVVALSSGVSTALLAILWIAGVHAVEANLLNPKIMGDAAKIHPVLVILALVIGEHWYGLVGALLAVPLMSILATIFRAARTRAMQLDAEIALEENQQAPAPPRPRRGPRRASMIRIDHGG